MTLSGAALIVMIVAMVVLCGGMMLGMAVGWSQRAKRRRANGGTAHRGSG
jgi:hypothetical protein